MLLLYDEKQCTRCLGGHGLAYCGLEHELSWSHRLAVGHRRGPSEVNFVTQGKVTVRSQEGFEAKGPL